MTKFEELMRNKTNKINKMKTLSERKAVLEKNLWSVYLAESLNQMYVEIDTKRARLVVILNVENGEVKLRHMDELLATFNIDEKLISIMWYDVLIKDIGFEIEKYNLF